MSSSHSLAEEKVDSLSLSFLTFSSGSTFRPTASMAAESCPGPMTDVFVLGQIQRKRGQCARLLLMSVSGTEHSL